MSQYPPSGRAQQPHFYYPPPSNASSRYSSNLQLPQPHPVHGGVSSQGEFHGEDLDNIGHTNAADTSHLYYSSSQGHVIIIWSSKTDTDTSSFEYRVSQRQLESEC